MNAPPTVPARHPGPRVLATGWYVALIAGVCLLMALVGATAQEFGPELGGAWAGWIAFGVVCLVCGVIAVRVGNPTTPIVCAALVGMSTMDPAKELGQSLGGVWGRWAVGLLVFGAVYYVWATVIHPRLAGRPTP